MQTLDEGKAELEARWTQWEAWAGLEVPRAEIGGSDSRNGQEPIPHSRVDIAAGMTRARWQGTELAGMGEHQRAVGVLQVLDLADDATEARMCCP